MRVNLFRSFDLLKYGPLWLDDVNAVPSETLSTGDFNLTLTTDDLTEDGTLFVDLYVYVQPTCYVNPIHR